MFLCPNLQNDHHFLLLASRRFSWNCCDFCLNEFTIVYPVPNKLAHMIEHCKKDKKAYNRCLHWISLANIYKLYRANGAIQNIHMQNNCALVSGIVRGWTAICTVTLLCHSHVQLHCCATDIAGDVPVGRSALQWRDDFQCRCNAPPIVSRPYINSSWLAIWYHVAQTRNRVFAVGMPTWIPLFVGSTFLQMIWIA